MILRDLGLKKGSLLAYDRKEAKFRDLSEWVTAVCDQLKEESVIGLLGQVLVELNDLLKGLRKMLSYEVH